MDKSPWVDAADKIAPSIQSARVGIAFGSTVSIASRSDGRAVTPMKSVSKTITRQPDWLGPAVAPGEILLEEYLKPLGLGQVEAARRLGISLNRLNERSG